MQETNQATTPNQPKEATMQEPMQQPPEWTQVLSMFDAMYSVVLKYAEPHIKRMVDEATTPLVERIKYLENHSAAADNTFTLAQRIELLERRLDNITTATDERIKEIADDAARMVFAEHTEEYDHDWYDREIENINDKVGEALDDYDFEDKVRDAVRDLSFTVTVD